MTEHHCPHDGAVLEPAIDFCPVCGEEFTGAVGTAIKERIEKDTIKTIVRWIRMDKRYGDESKYDLADAIEDGEWRRKL